MAVIPTYDPAKTKLYDPTYDAWPDLRQGAIVLAPVRVGVDRHTGKIIVGWDHVLQSIYLIFATRFHERVLRRWVGSFIQHILGENIIERTLTNFYWAVKTSIDLWEPNYDIQRIVIENRDDGSQMNIPEEIRKGNLSTRNDGVYRPRAHLGDKTPEPQGATTFINVGSGIWGSR